MSGRAGWTFGPQPAPASGTPIPMTCRHPEGVFLWRRSFEPALPATWYRVDLAYGEAGMVDARVALVLDDGKRLLQVLAKTGRNRFSGLFRPILPLAAVEIEVSGSLALDAPKTLALRSVSRWEKRFALMRRSLDVLKGDPHSFLWRAARFAVQLKRQGRTTIPATTVARSPQAAYALWRVRFDEREEDRALHVGRLQRLKVRPLFTIVAAADFDAAAVAALSESLQAQLYDAWELFVPRSCTEAGLLPNAAAAPRRCAVARDVGEALLRLEGRFVLLPRPGIVLRPHALLVIAAMAERFSEVEVIYADDDDIGRSNPRFKPGWSPRRLASFDYVGDLCAIGAGVLRAAVAAQDAPAPRADVVPPAMRHSLLQAVTAALPASRIAHVAQILSHAAPVPLPPPPPPPRFPRPSPPPLVSLIIPTRDRADLLRMSVGSIRARTAYPNYEIILVDNGSREPETLALFERWAADPVIRILREDAPFNYAALNNHAARAARGDVLGLINNDVDVQDGGWLDEMVPLALDPEVGCVGAKLLYPDGRLQHGGVVTGIAGVAGHRNKRAGRGVRGRLDDLMCINEVSAVTAACLLVRREVYVAVGGLDEAAFAVAYNDVDFCLKVVAAGYRNLWTPFAVLYHHESVSRGRDLSPRTAERFNRENLNLRLRWGARLLDDPYYSPNLTVDAETGSIRTQ